MFNKKDFVIKNCPCPPYKVEYILYKDETEVSPRKKIRNLHKIQTFEDIYKVGKDKGNFYRHHVCFAYLCGDISNHDGNNRMLCKVRPNKRFTKEQLKQWYKLSMKHGLLPKYCSPSKIADTNILILDDIEKSAPNKLYVYLTTVRMLEEESNIVEATLKLVEAGYHFILALIFAPTLTSVHNYGHMFFQVNCGGYYGAQDKDSVPLSTMIGLARLIQSDFEIKRGKDFYCNSMINSLSKVKYSIGAENIDAINKHFSKILRLEDEAITQYLKKNNLIK